MSGLPPTSWLQAFETAARNSSFSAAAEELGMTPAAVSQKIKMLEQHLDVQLFNRYPRGVALTDVGHAYAQPIRKSFADMQEATDGLFNSSQKHVVRIHASISYAALVLAPRLSAFQTANPNIDLCLTTSVWTEPSENHSVDFEIRYGFGDWNETVVHHLGHRFANIVCHPDFAASFRKTPTFQDLAAHAVQIIGSEQDWPLMASKCGMELPAVMGCTRADSSLIARQIVAGGGGAAILSENFTSKLKEQGTLISPLEFRLPLPRSFFVVERNNALKKPQARRVFDWIVNQGADMAG